MCCNARFQLNLNLHVLLKKCSSLVASNWAQHLEGKDYEDTSEVCMVSGRSMMTTIAIVIVQLAFGMAVTLVKFSHSLFPGYSSHLYAIGFQDLAVYPLAATLYSCTLKVESCGKS